MLNTMNFLTNHNIKIKNNVKKLKSSVPYIDYDSVKIKTTVYQQVSVMYKALHLSASNKAKQ